MLHKPKNAPCLVQNDEGKHMRLLNHDYHTMSYEEKISHWRSCAATRMNNIIENENTSKQIIDIWPQYMAPDGYLLVFNTIDSNLHSPHYSHSFLHIVSIYYLQIESDFKYLHGENSGLLDNIDQFCELMLDNIFPARLKDFRGDDKSWFDKLIAKKHIL